MNRLAALFHHHSRWVWAFFGVLGLVCAGWAGWFDLHWRSQERLGHLQMGVNSAAAEIASSALKGDLMGSLVLLGTQDQDIKQDVTGGARSEGAQIDRTLGIVGTLFDARGVFLISTEGIIQSSWSSSGRPNTGLNVRFRPYYQTAIQGKTSVYAAVGTSSGERTLYYAAPVFPQAARTALGVGAVVAQGKVDWLDALLRNQGCKTVLLSPQGVVFATSQTQWLGGLSGPSSPKRLRAIRELKQFGKWFDTAEPRSLPFAATTGVQTVQGVRHMVTTAEVAWGDPAGPWQLVFLEDLSDTVSVGATTARVAAVSLLYALLVWLGVRLLKGHHRQRVTSSQLALLADGQSQQLRFRAKLAGALVRLQQSESIAALAQNFLSDAYSLFGTLQGVVYVRENAPENTPKNAPQNAIHTSHTGSAAQHTSAQTPHHNTPADASARFVLRGSFACADPPAPVLHAGEGVLGQCAIECVPRTLAAGQQGWGNIRSGLGATAPGCVVCMPLLGQDGVLGLVEVATLGTPQAFPMDAFGEFANSLALNLQILLRAEQTQASLLQTERIRQHGAEQLQWQQALIDAMPYPVFHKDANGLFTGFNRAYAATFAATREALIGKSLMVLESLSVQDRRIYEAEDQHLIRTGSSVSRLIEIPFADGKLHKTLYFAAGFAQPDGSPGGMVGTFADLELVYALAPETPHLADAPIHPPMHAATQAQTDGGSGKAQGAHT